MKIFIAGIELTILLNDVVSHILVGYPRYQEPALRIRRPDNLTILLTILPMEIPTSQNSIFDHGVIIVDLLVYLG